MVKYAISASLAFVQLAIVAQTSFGLPVNSKNGLESRSISDRDVQQRLDQRDLTELNKREPMLGLLLGAGLVGGALYLHNKHKKEKEAQAATQNSQPSSERRDLHGVDLDERDWDDFEKRYLEDVVKRDWDDYELEARNYLEQKLDELN